MKLYISGYMQHPQKKYIINFIKNHICCIYPEIQKTYLVFQGSKKASLFKEEDWINKNGLDTIFIDEESVLINFPLNIKKYDIKWWIIHELYHWRQIKEGRLKFGKKGCQIIYYKSRNQKTFNKYIYYAFKTDGKSYNYFSYRKVINNKIYEGLQLPWERENKKWMIRNNPEVF